MTIIKRMKQVLSHKFLSIPMAVAAFTLFFSAHGVPIFAEERKNLSIEDVISGFQSKELFYYESIFQNGKYLKTFNKCLASIPADPAWMRQHCEKHPEFKNAFQCTEDGSITHVWFIYENPNLCEEVRGPMKDKMDAIRE